MNTLVQMLSSSGWQLLLGATLILFVFCFAMLAQRSPIGRQRTGELAIGAALLWVLMAFVPKPDIQPAWQHLNPFDDAATDQVAMSPDEQASWRTGIPSPTMSQELLADVISSAGSSSPKQDLSTPLPALVSDHNVSGYDNIWEGFQPAEANGLFGLQRPGYDAHLESSPLLAPAAEAVSDGRGQAAVSAGPLGLDGLSKLFLLGFIGAFAWIGFGWVLLQRQVRRSVAAEPWLDQLFRESCQGILKRPPRLVVSRLARRVVSFGIFWPTVLLPSEIVQKRNYSQLRHVLLHELGHIRQRDAIGQAVMNLGFLVFFFHPIYWWIRCQIHFNRELVIDDWACHRAAKSDYVTDLVALAKSRLAFDAGSLHAIGVHELRGSVFYRRIKMLINRKAALATRCSRRWILTQSLLSAVVALALVASVGAPSAVAQSRQSDKDRRIEELTAKNHELQDRLHVTEAQLKEMQVMMQHFEQQMAERSVREQARADELALAEKRIAEAVDETFGESEYLQPPQSSEAVQKRLIELLSMREMLSGNLGPEHAQILNLDKQIERWTKYLESGGTSAEQQRIRQSVAETEQEQQLQQTQQQLADMEARLANEQDQRHVIAQQRLVELEQLQAEKQQLITELENMRASQPSDSIPEEPARSRRAEPAPRPAGSLTASQTSAQTDLVQLATSYIDALAARDIARVEFEHAAELAKTNAGPKIAVTVAEVKLRSQTQKAELLQRVAEVTMRALEGELHQAVTQFSESERLVERGFLNASAIEAGRAKIMAAEANLEIIKQILSSR